MKLLRVLLKSMKPPASGRFHMARSKAKSAAAHTASSIKGARQHRYFLNLSPAGMPRLLLPISNSAARQPQAIRSAQTPNSSKRQTYPQRESRKPRISGVFCIKPLRFLMLCSMSAMPPTVPTAAGLEKFMLR